MATIAGFLVAASAAAIGAAALADRKTQTPVDSTLRQDAIAVPGAVPVVAEEETALGAVPVVAEEENQGVVDQGTVPVVAEDPQNVQQGGAIGRPPWGEITMTSTGPVSLETGKPMTVQFTGVASNDLFSQMTQAQRERDELELKKNALEAKISDITKEGNPTAITQGEANAEKIRAEIAGLKTKLRGLEIKYRSASDTSAPAGATGATGAVDPTLLEAQIQSIQKTIYDKTAEYTNERNNIPYSKFMKARNAFAYAKAGYDATVLIKSAYSDRLRKAMTPMSKDEWVNKKLNEWKATYTGTDGKEKEKAINAQRELFRSQYTSQDIDQGTVDEIIEKIRQADEAETRYEQRKIDTEKAFKDVEANLAKLNAELADVKRKLGDAKDTYKKIVDSYRATVKLSSDEKVDKPDVYVKPADLDARKKELARRYAIYQAALERYESFMGSEYYATNEKAPLESKKTFLESKRDLAEKNYGIASQNLTRTDALPFIGEAPPPVPEAVFEGVFSKKKDTTVSAYEQEWKALITSLFKPTDKQKEALLKPDIFPVLKMLSEPYDMTKTAEYLKVLSGGAQVFAKRLFDLTDIYSDCFIQPGDSYTKTDGTKGDVKDLVYKSGVCTHIISKKDGKSINVSEISLDLTNPTGDSGRLHVFLDKLNARLGTFNGDDITRFILGMVVPMTSVPALRTATRIVVPKILEFDTLSIGNINEWITTTYKNFIGSSEKVTPISPSPVFSGIVKSGIDSTKLDTIQTPGRGDCLISALLLSISEPFRKVDTDTNRATISRAFRTLLVGMKDKTGKSIFTGDICGIGKDDTESSRELISTAIEPLLEKLNIGIVEVGSTSGGMSVDFVNREKSPVTWIMIYSASSHFSSMRYDGKFILEKPFDIFRDILTESAAAAATTAPPAATTTPPAATTAPPPAAPAPAPMPGGADSPGEQKQVRDGFFALRVSLSIATRRFAPASISNTEEFKEGQKILEKAKKALKNENTWRKYIEAEITNPLRFKDYNLDYAVIYEAFTRRLTVANSIQLLEEIIDVWKKVIKATEDADRRRDLETRMKEFEKNLKRLKGLPPSSEEEETGHILGEAFVSLAEAAPAAAPATTPLAATAAPAATAGPTIEERYRTRRAAAEARAPAAPAERERAEAEARAAAATAERERAEAAARAAAERARAAAERAERERAVAEAARREATMRNATAAAVESARTLRAQSEAAAAAATRAQNEARAQAAAAERTRRVAESAAAERERSAADGRPELNPFTPEGARAITEATPAAINDRCTQLLRTLGIDERTRRITTPIYDVIIRNAEHVGLTREQIDNCLRSNNIEISAPAEARPADAAVAATIEEITRTEVNDRCTQLLRTLGIDERTRRITTPIYDVIIRNAEHVGLTREQIDNCLRSNNIEISAPAEARPADAGEAEAAPGAAAAPADAGEGDAAQAAAATGEGAAPAAPADATPAAAADATSVAANQMSAEDKDNRITYLNERITEINAMFAAANARTRRTGRVTQFIISVDNVRNNFIKPRFDRINSTNDSATIVRLGNEIEKAYTRLKNEYDALPPDATGGFRNHVTRRHRPSRMFKARKTWRT